MLYLAVLLLPLKQFCILCGMNMLIFGSEESSWCLTSVRDIKHHRALLLILQALELEPVSDKNEQTMICTIRSLLVFPHSDCSAHGKGLVFTGGQVSDEQ